MVEPSGSSSNHLDDVFEELERWEEQLKHIDLDFPEAQP